MKMSNHTYDVLKYWALIVLPALGTLYFALAGIWGLPYGEQIVGTITAIDAFLGAILKISSDKYMEIQQGYNIDQDGITEDCEVDEDGEYDCPNIETAE